MRCVVVFVDMFKTILTTEDTLESLALFSVQQVCVFD